MILFPGLAMKLKMFVLQKFVVQNNVENSEKGQLSGATILSYELFSYPLITNHPLDARTFNWKILEMLLSFYPATPTNCCSHLRTSNYQSQPPHPSPATVLRFRTLYREKLTYLKKLGIVDSNPKKNNIPSHETLDQILTIINYLKSKGFSDSDIPKLSSDCPNLFLSGLEPADIGPVFHFLSTDLAASTHESCGLVLCCPELLFSNVDGCLRPTLAFLRSIGLERLNSPTNLNAHLLNTRVSKLEAKIKFLRSIGFSYEESENTCARLPAIFGYSIENNMRPKVEYLVEGMQRSIEELKEFPQYLAFSLRRRIVPRHMHLKQRSVNISLKRMLLCGDEKFYAKWK